MSKRILAETGDKMNIITSDKFKNVLQPAVEVKTQQEVYVEAPVHAPTSFDPLGQFKANLKNLEQMQAKMSFMLQEVQSLIK